MMAFLRSLASAPSLTSTLLYSPWLAGVLAKTCRLRAQPARGREALGAQASMRAARASASGARKARRGSRLAVELRSMVREQ